jgi:hypothetical protein
MPTRLAQTEIIERVPIQLCHTGAIQAALKGINDHKTGLPEFMKNSAGAYYRLSKDSDFARNKCSRMIILLFRTPRGRRAGVIGCLDLAGMTPQDITMFQQWFDPTASSRGDSSGELWGGHGNGAKSYMLKMFNNSWFATVRDSRYTKMGWLNQGLNPDYKIGFIPSRKEADAVQASASLELLDTLLKSTFGATLSALPQEAQDILTTRPAWTCFVGSSPKNWVPPDRLIPLCNIILKLWVLLNIVQSQR